MVWMPPRAWSGGPFPSSCHGSARASFPAPGSPLPLMSLEVVPRTSRPTTSASICSLKSPLALRLEVPVALTKGKDEEVWACYMKEISYAICAVR
ncbi:hypothetical protein CVT26_015544 [Gymnopilus dilepis]|uniref:Uncharacterized protein n=1 Tax=Gymnopilus dilepis TaxID=231916 RepID=A0A409YD52_9AGAR|nr:hypothetical protein CVT26_015544 [Gymnopilus dilepis]